MSTVEAVLGFEVPREDAQRIQDLAKSLSIASSVYKVSKSQNNPEKNVIVPLDDDIEKQKAVEAWASLGITKPGCGVVTVSPSTLTPLNPKKSQGETGIDQIRSELRNKFKWTEKDAKSVPEKWLKYGDVLVLFAENKGDITGNPKELLEVFKASDKKLRCIVLHTGKIEGELREPRMRMLTEGESSETVHTENGFKYKFDVMHVMFAPGNGTERMRFSKMNIEKPETIVDMFVGLGYFTIPLSAGNKDMIVKYIAIEKNPTSFGYLKQNLVLNGVDKIVEAINGDNRHVADELIGKCDRILMGYLPTTKDFLPRAFQFAKRGGCLIHYHYIAKKGEAEDQLRLEFNEAFASQGIKDAKVDIKFVSKVKNYAPQLLHYCTDVTLYL